MKVKDLKCKLVSIQNIELYNAINGDYLGDESVINNFLEYEIHIIYSDYNDSKYQDVLIIEVIEYE